MATRFTSQQVWKVLRERGSFAAKSPNREDQTRLQLRNTLTGTRSVESCVGTDHTYDIWAMHQFPPSLCLPAKIRLTSVESSVWAWWAGSAKTTALQYIKKVQSLWEPWSSSWDLVATRAMTHSDHRVTQACSPRASPPSWKSESFLRGHPKGAEGCTSCRIDTTTNLLIRVSLRPENSFLPKNCYF